MGGKKQPRKGYSQQKRPKAIPAEQTAKSGGAQMIEFRHGGGPIREGGRGRRQEELLHCSGRRCRDKHILSHINFLGGAPSPTPYSFFAKKKKIITPTPPFRVPLPRLHLHPPRPPLPRRLRGRSASGSSLFRGHHRHRQPCGGGSGLGARLLPPLSSWAT